MICPDTNQECKGSQCSEWSDNPFLFIIPLDLDLEDVMEFFVDQDMKGKIGYIPMMWLAYSRMSTIGGFLGGSSDSSGNSSNSDFSKCRKYGSQK